MTARDRRVAVGVIGAGAIGRLHAENLASRVAGADLVAVADVSRAAAADCASQCGAAAVYEDYRDLLSHRGIEAVVICSPPDTHAGIIGEAAALGRHVFCEKPIDCDLSEIDKALDAVTKAGVKLQVGFNRRFDPDFRYVHETVASGGIGRPYILHITSRDPLRPPAPATGAAVGLFLDTTVHDFDMARYLIGSEVTSVYVLAGDMVHRGGDMDTAVITLRFANGALGTIDNGQAVYGYDQRVEVFGSEGAVAVGNEKPHRAALSDRQGVHTALPLPFFRERYAVSYVAEMSAFIDCILRDTDPPVTGADGRVAVALALAALRSHAEGRPVALSEFEGP